MRIDMHVHSTFSDGEKTPLELLKMCYRDNISVVSITDHGNFEGAREAISNNPYPDVKVIPGIEFSAECNTGKLHILGYGFDMDNKDLNEITTQILDGRRLRVKSLIDILMHDYKIKFNEEDVYSLVNAKGAVGKPMVAKLLVKYGYSSDVKSAFSRFFEPVKHKLPDFNIKLSDRDCIKYINSAGGIVSIAHPITLKKDYEDLRSYIGKLAEKGLGAIEVYHSDHPHRFRKELIHIANEFGLLQSGGSDYHGPMVKPDIRLGRGINNNLYITNLSIISKLG